MLDVTRSSSFAAVAHEAIPAHPLHPVDFSRTKVALLFVLMMAMTSIPILLHPLPPISDYINHLARMHVIATINSDPDLARYYEVDWQVIPNLMMDLIVPLFERVMNVYLAGQTYTILSFALILSATVALHRQLFGRWSILPLVAFPLLYNNVFLVGTMNYVFGIGMALWGLVAWAALRERNIALRLSVSALFVLALFFCHLFALGVYGLALLAFEVNRLRTELRQAAAAGRGAAVRDWAPLVADFVVTGVPFLPVLPLLMMSPTRRLWDTYEWQFHGKLGAFVYVIELYSHELAFALTAVLAFVVGWALRSRALSFHPFGVILLVIGAIAYLALPRVMFDTYLVDLRLPISLVFALIACIKVDFKNRMVRWAFAVGIVAFLGARVIEVERTWNDLGSATNSFRQSVQQIDHGAKVLVAYDDPHGGDRLRDYGLVHADCIAIIERSALVTTAFTVVGKQVLHARPDYRERVDTQDGTPPMIDDVVEVAYHADNKPGEYWRNWTSDYDYLYVLFTDEDFENPDPKHLTEIFSGERFVLYHIEQAPLTEASKRSK